ncbi:MAG TPA: hypothetical protein DCS21_00220 [Gammaproteobacteria bacterium]|nr:hypothetical protein [Gammaproteobacteria bacterium]
MSLRTEQNDDLLTESGLPLWAENETASGAIDVTLRSQAALHLIAQATLNSVKIFTVVPLQASCTAKSTPPVNPVRSVPNSTRRYWRSSVAWREIYHPDTLPERRATLYTALPEYCALDTMALVRLAHFLS